MLRETVSSYTVASIVDSERHEHLLNGLLILYAELKSLHDGGVTVRVDPASGFSALMKDPLKQRM